MSAADKVCIAPELVEKIRQHGVASYPHECCGALLGRDASIDTKSSGPRQILELFPLVNRRDDSPHNRFAVAPRDVIGADRAAQERGLEVVGWYHSHPDHPARPSEYDREHAWPWYSYIIVSVLQRVPGEMNSWRLKEDRTGYTQEPIEINGKDSVHL